MADKTEKWELQLALRDALSAPMAAINSTLRGTSNLIKSINSLGGGSGAGGTIGRMLFGFGGSFLIVESLKKALDLAKGFETNQAKLSIALDGNISRYKQIQSTIEQISKAGVFGQGDLTAAAQQLVERGVPDDQLGRTLQVTADTAAALKIPLEEAGDQIAQTFGGILPKSLSRAVPAIHNLSVESLKAGGALDVLSKAFHGQDAEFATSAAGRDVAALRDITQAWTDFGKALLPIERQILPGIASILKNAGDLYGSGSADSFSLREFVGSYVDIDGVTDQKTINSLRSKQASDSLDAQAADARKRMVDSQQQINDLEQNGLEENNKKAVAETEKTADEELRAKTLSLTKYLAEVDRAASVEKSRLEALAATQRSQLAHVASDIAEQMNTLKKLGGDFNGDPTHDQRLADAMHLTEIRIADDLQKQLDLKRDILQTTGEIADADRASLDQHVKAIEEAGKAAPEQAKDLLGQFQGGSLSQGDLQSRVSDLMGQINSSVSATTGQIQGEVAAGILSQPDADAIIARLQQIQSKAKQQADQTVHYVRDAATAQADASKTLEESASKGLASGLTDVEIHAKTAKQALLEMAQSFVKSMLDIVNQRLAEQVIGVLNGNTPGGGVFGALGGLLVGSNASGGVISGVASAAGGAINGAGNLIGKVLGSLFAAGGYTGAGNPSHPAGIVHRGEYVIPADVTRSLGLANISPDHVGQVLAGRTGRYLSSNGSRSLGDVGSNKELISAIHDLVDSNRRPIAAAVHVDAVSFRQIVNGTGSAKVLADLMQQHPDVFRPVMASLRR